LFLNIVEKGIHIDKNLSWGIEVLKL